MTTSSTWAPLTCCLALRGAVSHTNHRCIRGDELAWLPEQTCCWAAPLRHLQAMRCFGLKESCAQYHDTFHATSADIYFCSCSGSMCEPEPQQHLGGATRQPRSAEVRALSNQTTCFSNLYVTEPQPAQSLTRTHTNNHSLLIGS